MKFFISIVSHQHHDLIINLSVMKLLSAFPDVQVICSDNKPAEKLKQYCEKYHVHYIGNKSEQGFAENNNQNYLYCESNLGMKKEDYFILLNPDILITKKNIQLLIKQLNKKPTMFATVNLFLDKEEIVHDDNVRLYPKFRDFLSTYLFNKRATMINRKHGLSASSHYWTSGAFMIVKSKLYKQLQGLDERYYMYCEDIDFSYRAKLAGIKLEYLSDIKAIHFRHCNSKQLFSKYFFWHVISVFKYSFTKKKLVCTSSKLKNNNECSND